MFTNNDSCIFGSELNSLKFYPCSVYILFFFGFWLFVDFIFYDELDFIPDLLWCDAKDDDAGRPLTELEFRPEVFWLCVDLECDAFPPMLEWYFNPYTFFLDSSSSM